MKLCLALFLLAGPSDLHFEQVTFSGVAGQPTGPGVTSRVWSAQGKLRLEAGGEASGHALILRLDRGLAWRLDPETRTAIALDLERLRSQAQLDAAQAGDLLRGGAETARRTPLPGERRIAGQACRGFRIAAGAAVLHVYVASDLPVGVEAFTDFLEWSGAGAALGPLLDEIRQLPGFPLETRAQLRVGGVQHEMVSSVTKLVIGPQPAELFEPPLGYRIEAEAR